MVRFTKQKKAELDYIAQTMFEATLAMDASKAKFRERAA